MFRNVLCLFIAAAVALPAFAKDSSSNCEVRAAPAAESIVRARLLTNHFTTDRGLRAAPGWPRFHCSSTFPFIEMSCPFQGYEQILDRRFFTILAGLNELSHWVDMGAGKSLSLLQYLRDPAFPRKARLTGVGFKMPKLAYVRATQKIQNTFRYLEGDVLARTSTEIGAADVITDVFGPMHYSSQLDEVLQIYFEVLKVGGYFFTSDVVWPDGWHRPAATIHLNGLAISFFDWLRRIPGLDCVRGVPDSSIVCRKVADQVRIPKLELIDYSLGSPPARLYRSSPILAP